MEDNKCAVFKDLQYISKVCLTVGLSPNICLVALNWHMFLN